MNLYIETENGVAKNHPAYEDNLIQAFGSIPEHWESFTRVEGPGLSVYQVLESAYAKVDGVWMDVWTVRDMTLEEKTARQQEVIASFNTREQAENWSAWTLDEATCTMQPPIPRPEPVEVEGKIVFWCGADNNWKEAPAYPADDKNYRFDFFAWAWAEITE